MLAIPTEDRQALREYAASVVAEARQVNARAPKTDRFTPEDVARVRAEAAQSVARAEPYVAPPQDRGPSRLWHLVVALLGFGASR